MKKNYRKSSYLIFIFSVVTFFVNINSVFAWDEIGKDYQNVSPNYYEGPEPYFDVPYNDQEDNSNYQYDSSSSEEDSSGYINENWNLSDDDYSPIFTPSDSDWQTNDSYFIPSNNTNTIQPQGSPWLLSPSDSSLPSQEDSLGKNNNKNDEESRYKPLQRIKNKEAVFYGLDKISGQVYVFQVPMDDTYQFGSLQVTPKVCYTSAENEPSRTDAFVEVKATTLDQKIQEIFSGWMFSNSPGLNAVDHPVYDVWLKDCQTPIAEEPLTKSDTAQ